MGKRVLGIGLLIGILYLHLPIAFIAGLVELHRGGRGLFPGWFPALAVKFAIHTFIVGGLIFWPLTQTVNWEDKKRTEILRLFLLIIPSLLVVLVSYGYFISHTKRLAEALDILYTVAPIVVICVVMWSAINRAVLAGTYLCLATFVAFYGVQDILAPFSTVIFYASQGPAFYLLKNLITLFALAGVLYVFNPTARRGKIFEWLFFR